MTTRKKFIILSVLIVFLLVVVVNYAIQRQKQEEKTVEPEAAKEEIVLELEKEIGGTIIKEGFNISYESGKDLLIITVTDVPFSTNEQGAIEYLEQRGVDICETDIIILPGRGVDMPEDYKSNLEIICNKRN